jgi:Protein of unknown function (DUF2804)
VGVFCEQLMACAALVQVGVARQSFWAVLSRAEAQLRERTRLWRPAGAVELSPGRMLVHDADVMLDVRLEENAGVEVVCPHGRGEVWTRKQAGIAAHVRISLDGARPTELEALAIVDDTAGYHARHTEWRWSAGVGVGADGVALAWNLVDGVNDPRTGSERAVWIDGRPREVSPVEFSADLSKIRCEDGSELRFTAEAERSRKEDLLIIKSDYRAPFGTFAGTLPGGVALVHGLGVSEHHRALW